MKFYHSLILLLSLIFPSAYALTPGEVPVGGVLRDATLQGFGGDVLRLSSLRGKPLIINVWASWCGPCKAEMGSLENLHKRYGGKQFNLIGISTDDDTNAAFYFLMREGITFDNYADKNLMMENMLGANTIPVTLLIDANGKVLKKVRGFKEWDSPETIKMIASVLGVKL
ncbi:MAG: TlpA family protein disulfide reductase [Gammaproteobacteria bacterium]|nr:TlpA family protein disulfide reductase [Gammaproteobacteria bacterium]